MKKILDVIAFLFMLANVAVSLVFYFTTDKIAVPVHWSTVASADSYGRTWMILFSAGITVVVYLLMLWSEKRHMLNTPFLIKDKEKARPYIDMDLAWTSAIVMGLMFYVDLAVAQYVRFWMLLVAVLILVIIVINWAYMARIYKIGRK